MKISSFFLFLINTYKPKNIFADLNFDPKSHDMIIHTFLPSLRYIYSANLTILPDVIHKLLAFGLFFIALIDL